ncbi:hypothetical protein ACIOHE_15485 [Streptomyces sp. NPDC087851]
MHRITRLAVAALLALAAVALPATAATAGDRTTVVAEPTGDVGWG